MNAEYVQNLRYKLQKRVRRLSSVDFRIYQDTLQQFWGFLTHHPVLAGVAADLVRRCPEAESAADRFIDGGNDWFNDEVGNAAMCYFLLKKCAESRGSMEASTLGSRFCSSTQFNEMLEALNSAVLEPVYEYLDEQLDDRGAVLALLRRYKHKCEWFRRDELRELWEQHTSQGERLLARNLYEYLHDQGLEFVIEPWSASGEADLVSSQQGSEPLIADVKIFNPDKAKDKAYIASGFHQVYTYTLDHNEPFGYLVIFNTGAVDLKFALAEESQHIPFVVHNGKTIFLITIDISHYDESASKRGKLKSVVITEADLVAEVDSPQEAAVAQSAPEESPGATATGSGGE